MTPQDELTFADFMSARWSPLFRTAYLLTGNRTEAEDLLQTALARTYVRWKGIRDKGAADAYVRRAMVNLASRQWRTRGREVSLDVLPEPAHDGGFGSSDARMHTVALSDSAEGSTSIYDVSSGEAVVLDEFPGWGELSPDGSAFLATPGEEEAGRPVLWTRAGEARSVTGLAGTVTGVTWADDETAAVTTSTWVGGQQERTDVYVCEVSNARCALALEGGQGEVSVRY